MSRREGCTPEQQAACPLFNHYTDEHHLAFPRRAYRTKVEKRWREQPINKVQLCRAAHEAIHASGYLPEKPLREEMVAELWAKEPTERSQAELDKQVFLGELNLRGGRPEESA